MTYVKKSWGSEKWLVNNKKENYCLKILDINKDCSTSLHYHKNKHETFVIISGKLSVFLDNFPYESNKVLSADDTFEIDRLVRHKLFAHEGPVSFYEVSTYHENSDSYRCD